MFAVICATAGDRNAESKGGMTARQESASEAELKNKNRLAKILQDLKSLDHCGVKKLHRILMHGKVQRKLNKALRKDTGKTGNKNIFLQLRASDVNHGGENSQFNKHQLKRFLTHSKKPSVELERRSLLKNTATSVLGKSWIRKSRTTINLESPKPH